MDNIIDDMVTNACNDVNKQIELALIACIDNYVGVPYKLEDIKHRLSSVKYIQGDTYYYIDDICIMRAIKSKFLNTTKTLTIIQEYVI